MNIDPNHDPRDRVEPPLEDDEEARREYGRQLAIDGLLQRLLADDREAMVTGDQGRPAVLAKDEDAIVARQAGPATGSPSLAGRRRVSVRRVLREKRSSLWPYACAAASLWVAVGLGVLLSAGPSKRRRTAVAARPAETGERVLPGEPIPAPAPRAVTPAGQGAIEIPKSPPLSPDAVAATPPVIPPVPQVARAPIAAAGEQAASRREIAQAPAPIPRMRPSDTPANPAQDGSETDRPLARLVEFQGAVYYARGASGPWLKAVAGVSLLAGDRIETRRGKATLELAGAGVQINRQSVVRLRIAETARGEAPLVTVDRGEVYVADRGTPVYVETLDGFVMPVGTQFNVKRSFASTEVTVEEGAVLVQAKRKPPHRAPVAPESRRVAISPLLWEVAGQRIEAGEQVCIRRGVKPSRPVKADVGRVVAWTRSRVSAGLQVLYRFDEGRGPVVRDRSGVGRPLDLLVRNPAAVRWVAGGLHVRAPTLVASPGAADKLIRACRASGAITIEAWIRPDNPAQKGLGGRIVTLSVDWARRNFTLGMNGHEQPKRSYWARLRTTETTLNGTPTLPTPARTTIGRVTHVAYTRSAAGEARLYVDGTPRARQELKGQFANWDASFRLALAGELEGKRPWLGTYYLVAVYSRALTSDQIARNFHAGHR